MNFKQPLDIQISRKKSLIQRHQTELRSMLIDLIKEKLNKYFALSGKDYFGIDYKTQSNIELFTLSIKDGIISYRYYQSVNKLSFTLEDLENIINIIDNKLKEYQPLEPYLQSFKPTEFTIIEKAYEEYRNITITVTSLDELFIHLYKLNNRYKYCNGHSFHFENEGLQNQYYQWLKILPDNRSFELYYGNSVVD